MAQRKWRKLAILTKIEASYGVDPTPTGAANAILGIDAKLTYDGQQVSRELLFPYLGHQGVLLTGTVGKLEYSVEIAGAGAAGSAPKWGPSIRACGMAETLSAGVSATYSFVSAGQEAVTHYFNRDGVRQVLLGNRGSCSIGLSPQGIPRFRFSYTGLLGTVSDAALPATTLTGFVKPVIVNKANTTMSLHAISLIGQSLSLDFGNQVEPRLLVGYEGIEIVDRQMTGSAVFEADAIATKDWLATALASTTGALAVTHGTAPGNIVSFAAPAVQVGLPAEGETQKIVNNTLPLMLQPVSGNDEFTITVT